MWWHTEVKNPSLVWLSALLDVGAKMFQDWVSLSPLLGYTFLCIASIIRQVLPVASKMAARSSGTVSYLFSNPVKKK